MKSERRAQGRKTQASPSFFPEDEQGPAPMAMADRTPEPMSVAPAAIDWPNGAPFDVPTTSIEHPGPRLAGPAIGVALLALGIAIAAFARSGVGHETSAAAAPPPPATSVEIAPRKAEIPVVDVTTLPPAPTTGTVIGAEGHRLWIDGHLADDWKSEITCGPHIVQVGSAGVQRDVVVPCGDAITVQP